MDPNGKVALVTGGSSGIGQATALALGQAGASVVIADIDDAGGRETVTLIGKAGGQANFIHTDVASWEDLQRMVAFAEEAFRGLDILHNNAGVTTGWPRFPESPQQRWECTLTIDLWSVIAGIQAALPALRRRGGGVIINTASLGGIIAYQPDPVYAAAKHGVVGLTRSLAFLKEEANIRVNCICPAFADTPAVRAGIDDLPPEERAEREVFLSRTPLIPPSQVAKAVMELVWNDTFVGETMGVLYGRPPKLIGPAITLRQDPSQRLRGT
jgi:NAD(P)-dependent dehydrogenase (short-subunit alcohol dehydrogenase family)